MLITSSASIHAKSFLEVASEIRCLVRYHGYAEKSEFKKDFSGDWQQYISSLTKKEEKLLEQRKYFKNFISCKGGVCRLNNIKFKADRFGLVALVDFQNSIIPRSKDHQRISGNMQLSFYRSKAVIDTLWRDGKPLASSKHSLRGLLLDENSGFYVPALTAELPKETILKQFRKAKMSDPIYTHIRLQCN